MDEHKNTRRYQIEHMPAPAKVTIPMSQHIGVPCTPLVKVGDTVCKGQMIGNGEKGLVCPVHSSVSGKVSAITETYSVNGQKIKNVVIDNDGEDRISPDIKPFSKRLVDTSTEEIIDIIRNAGIAGLGGATFPTHAKVSSAVNKAKHIIVNCAECEPYITANHRLLLENPAAVINGLKILLKALSLRQGIIAIEDNKLDAINKFEGILANSELIKIKVLKTKYPQGDERQLIYAVLGIELPSGKLPADVGAVIFNPETCTAIFNAFAKGMPLIERNVTVDGDCVRTPKNVLVPLGTSYADLIKFCGGLKKEPKKLVAGGPMMGTAQWDINAPVAKATSALLVFSEQASKQYEQPPACIHCGRCVTHCQMRLMPTYLAGFAQAGRFDMCEKFDVMSCVECGTCSYVCPGNVPIVQYNRAVKAKINEERKARQAAMAAAAVSTEAPPPSAEQPKTDKIDNDTKPEKEEKSK